MIFKNKEQLEKEIKELKKILREEEGGLWASEHETFMEESREGVEKWKLILEERNKIIKIIERIYNKGYDEWVEEYHKKDCDCSLCLAFKQGLKEVLSKLKGNTKQS